MNSAIPKLTLFFRKNEKIALTLYSGIGVPGVSPDGRGENASPTKSVFFRTKSGSDRLEHTY